MMNMSRRNMLTATAGAVALGGGLSVQAAQQGEHGEHGHKAAAASGETEHAKLVAALNHCVSVSEACLQHCFDSFAAGDTSLARCAETVRDAIALCEATRTLANGRSFHLKAISAVCAATCESCRAECVKHVPHHPICGDCAESCVAVIAELKAI